MICCFEKMWNPLYHLDLNLNKFMTTAISAPFIQATLDSEPSDPLGKKKSVTGFSGLVTDFCLIAAAILSH